MQTILKERLWAYIIHNNPDLMFDLQEAYGVTQYLDQKVATIMPMAAKLLGEGQPQHIVVEQCVRTMTEELRPSRFHYIRTRIKEDFPKDYKILKEAGTLTYEICQLIVSSQAIFEEFDFCIENVDNHFLRHAVLKQIHDHLS